jgi:hypothetical protein
MTLCLITLSTYESVFMKTFSLLFLCLFINMFCGFKVSYNRFSRLYHDFNSIVLSIGSKSSNLNSILTETSKRVSFSPFQKPISSVLSGYLRIPGPNL